MSHFLRPLKWKRPERNRPVFRQLAPRVARLSDSIPQSLGRESTQRESMARGSVKRGLSQQPSGMINRSSLPRGLKVGSPEKASSPEPIAPRYVSLEAAYADEQESPRPMKPRLETQGSAEGTFFDTAQEEISSQVSGVLSTLSAAGVHRISARGRALLLAQGKLGEVLVRKNIKGEYFVQIGKAAYEISLKGKKFRGGESLLWVKQDNEVRSMALKGSNSIVSFKRKDDINTLCSQR
jgi:hypothetical protein